MKNLYKIFAFCVIALIIEGCATVKGDWEEASERNSIRAYSTFIKEHPDAEYVKEAKDRIEKLEEEANIWWENNAYKKAKDSNTKKSYEKFLKMYPSGKHAVEARKSLSIFEYEKVRKKNSERAYKDFLSRFPESDSAADASSRLKEIRYNKAIKTKTVSAYEKFIEQYPEEAEAEVLKKILKELRSWQESKEKKLGELAVQMAPTAAMSFTSKPTSNKLENSKFSIEQSPTLKQDLAEFHKLLKEGANPKLVRIVGFVPVKSTPAGSKFSMVSFGKADKAVPAEYGGITLLQYFKENKLIEAYKLLKKYWKE